MNRKDWLLSIPAALLCLSLGAPAGAQSPLNEAAPGLEDGQPAAAAPATQPGNAADTGTEAGPASGSEVNYGKTDVPATSIVRELAPMAGGNPGAPRQVKTPRGTVTIDAARSIDLTVFFAFDSDRLLPEARTQLNALGVALNDPALRPHSFLIAGHTDAKGSRSYNLDLSGRRALAVASYLIRYHRIAPGRLAAHGWGEARLKLPSDPLSGVNRRVEVSLLLPGRSNVTAPLGDWHHSAPRGDLRRVTWIPFMETPIRQTRHYHELSDPRWWLSSGALDDFNAAPTRADD